MTGKSKIRFIHNGYREELKFDSPPKFCDFEHLKDQYVSEDFIRRSLKDFLEDIKRMQRHYISPIEQYDPYFVYWENFIFRFTKLAYLRKEFSNGIAMSKPIFYAPESNILVGSGRCLIVGTYFKDMKVDVVKINEKKEIESKKKIYDFINSFQNESEEIILHIEKSKFIDAYIIADITFAKLEDCFSGSGTIVDKWHKKPDVLFLGKKVKKIIEKSNIHKINDLYDVLDEISLLLS